MNNTLNGFPVERKKLSELVKADYNPRKISEQAKKALQRSLKEFGTVEPIVFNKRSLTVVAGHQRLDALLAIGETESDIIIVDLPKNKEKALNVALNKISGEWEESKLSELFKELQMEDFDLTLTGFDDKEIQRLIDSLGGQDGLTDDDAIPEVIEPICKLGDLWKLGEHRLVCGDSTSKENVERLMAGQKADMVFTDPPYGMNLDTDWSSAKSSLKFADEKGLIGGKRYDKVIGDNEDFNPNFISSIFENFTYVKEIFTWGCDYYFELIPNRNKGSLVVWDKRLDESADLMYGSCFEICFSKSKHKRDFVRIKWAGVFGTEKEFDKKRSHPTQKPCELIIWFLEKFSAQNQIVVDLFLGSGSTLIACEKLNRKCYGMEIDPHYCDVIIKRWEDFTGKKAELLT